MNIYMYDDHINYHAKLLFQHNRLTLNVKMANELVVDKTQQQAAP